MDNITDAEKRAKQKYQKKLTKVNIVFYPKEQPLIDKINQETNKSGYIKELIKQDIENHKRNDS